MATFDQVYRDLPPTYNTFREMNPIDAYSVISDNLATSAIKNSLLSAVTSTRITQEDVNRAITYLMDCKIIDVKHKKMCETIFGLQVSHNFTNEEYFSLNKFQFIYTINKTAAADVVNHNNRACEVTIETIKKTVELEIPIEIAFGVEKELYERVKSALECVVGLCLPNKSKGYVGEMVIPNGSLVMFKQYMTNYISRVDMFTVYAAGALNQGETVRQLTYIYLKSPDIYCLPNKTCYSATASMRYWVQYVLDMTITYAYGLNKLWGAHREMSNSSKWLQMAIDMFKLNTSVSISPELLPYFENAQFKSIAGVITVTENIKRALIDAGLICTDYNVTMVQKISYCKISQEDTHPFDIMAPHASVSLKNSDIYQRDADGGLLTSEVRNDMNVDYIKHNGEIYVVSCVQDGDLGSCGGIVKSGMKQISQFDYMVPCGVQMVDDCMDPGTAKLLAPVPQSTMYKDVNGQTRTLSFKMAVPFLKSIFGSVPEEDERESEHDNGYQKMRARWGKRNEEEDERKDRTFERGESERKGDRTYDRGDEKDSSSKFKYGEADHDGTEDMIFFFHTNNSGQDRYLIDYTVSNVLMTKEIFLTNVMNCYHKQLTGDEERKKRIARYSDELEELTHFVDFLKDFYGYNRITKSPVADELIKNEMAFRTDIVLAARRQLGYSVVNEIDISDYTEDATTPDDIINNNILRSYMYVLRMKNKDMKHIHLDDGMNPGIAVLFIKPQFVESDSMIISRPCGYTHISANPFLTKKCDLSDNSKEVIFNFKQHACHTRSGLGNTSCKFSAAFMVRNYTDDTERCINPADDEAEHNLDLLARHNTTDVLQNIQNAQQVSRWWPVICTPKMPKSFFEKGGSPAGRITTQWIDKKMFDEQFYDTNVLDALFTEVYTVNNVFFNMRHNINTEFYKSSVLEREECPLNKYLNFNISSTNTIVNCRLNTRRRDSLLPHGCAFLEQDKNHRPLFPNEINLSKQSGVAFPKRCYTNVELLKQENQIGKPKTYPVLQVIQNTTTNDYFITGNGTVEKFDNGVGQGFYTT